MNRRTMRVCSRIGYLKLTIRTLIWKIKKEQTLKGFLIESGRPVKSDSGLLSGLEGYVFRALLLSGILLGIARNFLVGFLVEFV